MKKNVMKITAGVLSSAVLVGMCATGIPTKIAAATEHWNDASQESTNFQRICNPLFKKARPISLRIPKT